MMELPSDADEKTIVRHLADRRAIEDCLLRYCRGVDRLDKELMLSAYHADATDDHGCVVLGAEAFCDWAIEQTRRDHELTHHAISNVTIDIDGDVAHSECYFVWMGTIEGGRTLLAFGRYLDRLERRGGRWGIAGRQCFTEATHQIDVDRDRAIFDTVLKSNGPRTRDRGDASYQRPMLVDPTRDPGLERVIDPTRITA